ncbi:hypothetical protein Tco_0928930, partial [Tanacetum coccineum]
GGSVVPRILWRNLNGDATEAFRTRVVEGVSTQVDVLSTSDAVSMWNILTSTIKDVAKDPLELAIGTSKTYTAPQVKEKAYEELYKKMDSKEGANNIFKIEKAQERRRRDLGDICFIKDEGGQTITDEEEIKKRWGEYFSSLFSAREPEGHKEVVEPSIMPQLNIYHSRISEAEIFTGTKMPEEWRLSDERVIERRLRRETTVSEKKFGFIPGRSSVETIHLIRSLMEKYRERQRNLHMAFLDLEKVYDSVP